MKDDCKVRNLFDSHVHSCNSQDGQSPVMLLCRTALDYGLKGIAITDHCDIDSGRKRCFAVRDALLADVRQARDAFGDRLAISMGMELGEANHDPELARELTAEDGIDFVIGSLHCLRGERDFYFIDYDTVDVDDLLRRYYDELLEIVETGCFDVLAHINYQVRYMSDAARAKTDFRRHADRLEAVLTAAAQKGKGIEINTSSGRRDVGLIPAPDVVAMFRKAGGEIVTTGSDAHRAKLVGGGLSRAMAAAAAAGFERIAFFERRRPTMIAIA